MNTEHRFPMNPITSIHRLAVLGLLAASLPALAHEGHDEAPAAVASADAPPRFSAVSPSFELVGIVEGKQLTLYLDRFDDNSPVPDARIELALGSQTVAFEHHAEGAYEATLAQALSPGELAVKASVTAGGSTEQLTGDLDVHEDAHADDAHEEHASLPLAGWGGWTGAAAVAALAAWLLARRLAARRSRTGVAA